ncbi:MAG: class I SAM-dependent methyltransferase, partial [Anaerolineae bacterium]|nr:class I SAM-dependent methyltransferase [Anaerolineae bacterium]
MSRLAAQAKAEYYPTPLEVVDLLSTYLVLPRRKDEFARLLDPCCGEGLALERLAVRLREQTSTAIQTWGSELHPGRA